MYEVSSDIYSQFPSLSPPHADGLDVKVVQARLRHASAKTTLDVYGHMWPDKDEASRAAVAAVIAARDETTFAAAGNAPRQPG